MSDNSNNVHFSGVRCICSPYLAIKSALASLGPIIARCRAANEFYALKMNLIVILENRHETCREILKRCNLHNVKVLSKKLLIEIFDDVIAN